VAAEEIKDKVEVKIKVEEEKSMGQGAWCIGKDEGFGNTKFE